MAIGIKTFLQNGSLQLDLTNRTFRMLTTQLVGSGGSFTSAELAGGTPIVGVIGSDDNGRKPPTVTVSGNTVSWSHGSTPVGERDTDATIQVLLF